MKLKFDNNLYLEISRSTLKAGNVDNTKFFAVVRRDWTGLLQLVRPYRIVCSKNDISWNIYTIL